MSHIAILVDNLSKKYVISHQRERGHKTLCDVITERLTAPWRSLASRLKHVGTANNGNGNSPSVSGSQLNSELRPPTLTPALAPREDFWALKDVCFEIKQGEVVGVIGGNGAGKSTLLKILSRITEPTKGRIEIDGRAASLLEVGTGFHPELTGRENIYLNGAILGMKRVEIKRKFDEIVSFAEIQKFLDTPVKRYSSGMYVRLAFAVAAHLEPEILIVDEVLAVGDVQFQRKCLGKMQDVATKEGRTVLFVSHNMSAVNRLCSKVILMNSGKVEHIGPTANAIGLYSTSQSKKATSIDAMKERAGSGELRYTKITTNKNYHSVAEKKVVSFKISRQSPISTPFYISGILRQDDVNIFQYDSRMLDLWITPKDEIEGSIVFQNPWLKP
jgi:lipopolysaccharide transport system ATP-binding protein